MLQALQASSELIACTQGWKHQVELTSPAGLPVTVVPHGVDASALRRVPSQRRRFHIPHDSFAVGFVGSKTSNYDAGRKGLDTFHAIVQSARAKIPNLHISFLGLGWKAEVQSLRSQGLSANYVGFIPESQLASFYSSIDAYLMTSRVEGGPCTVLEAMACETPVVTTRVGLVPEVILDGVTGFSAEVGDSSSLAAHLCFLHSSPALARQVGAAARATVTSFRSWHQTLGQLALPLSRMQSRSTRQPASPNPASQRAAAHLAGAVHTIDGLLWGLVSCYQRLVSPPVAIRLVQSCWEGYRLPDVLRGLALVARLNFRPAALRKLLHEPPRNPEPGLAFPGPNTKTFEGTCP
jgi:hypothetical protein